MDASVMKNKTLVQATGLVLNLTSTQLLNQGLDSNVSLFSWSAYHASCSSSHSLQPGHLWSAFEILNTRVLGGKQLHKQNRSAV